MGSALGTIAYSAPETFLHNKLKKPSDVYAFGIMRELAVSRWLFSEQAGPVMRLSGMGCVCKRSSSSVHQQLWLPWAALIAAGMPCNTLLSSILCAVWEMFYCTEPYENLIDGQICLGVSGMVPLLQFTVS